MNVEDMHDRCEPVQPHSEPGKGDDVPCEKCGAIALDTGLECNECGHDNYAAVTGAHHTMTNAPMRPAVVGPLEPSVGRLGPEREDTMSTDTMKPQRTVLRDDRKTVTQLLAAAEKDTDAVSVFMAGCTVADTEAAVFVVKGPEAIAYLRELCKRQGLLTDKPVAGPVCNDCHKTPNVRAKPTKEAARHDRSEQT